MRRALRSRRARAVCRWRADRSRRFIAGEPAPRSIVGEPTPALFPESPPRPQFWTIDPDIVSALCGTVQPARGGGVSEPLQSVCCCTGYRDLHLVRRAQGTQP